MPSDDEIRKLLDDPSISGWFRVALRLALERDPVDAANDAGLLSLVLDRRAAEIAAAAEADFLMSKLLGSSKKPPE
jgi:hypothetical protein